MVPCGLLDWPLRGMKSYHPQGTPICFLSGEQHTPATGVNKCSNPDEGASNEVSSLANEKFISSRNTYGSKGKAVRVSGKPNTAFRCVGLRKEHWRIYQYKKWSMEGLPVQKLTTGEVQDKYTPSQAETALVF